MTTVHCTTEMTPDFLLLGPCKETVKWSKKWRWLYCKSYSMKFPKTFQTVSNSCLFFSDFVWELVYWSSNCIRHPCKNSVQCRSFVAIWTFLFEFHYANCSVYFPDSSSLESLAVKTEELHYKVNDEWVYGWCMVVIEMYGGPFY